MKIALLDDWQNNAFSFADFARLRADHQLDTYTDTISGPGLIERLQPYDVILAMRERTGLREGVLSQLPNLKAVITCGMRNAAIDLDYCKANQITVCGTEAPGHATAELAMMLVGMLARQLYPSVQSMASGGWQVSTGRDLRGARLGILGLGRLGSQLAGFGKAFGMEVQAWSQNLTAETCAEQGVRFASKDEFFSTSDYISIHLKLSDRVTGLVGAAELDLMKSDACIINTSRAPIIDQLALYTALEQGRIGGAALDVFDTEPLPADHSFRGLPNAILTPHVGYVTAETMRVFYGGMLEALEAFIADKPIRLLV
ncbi:lactate dehydrogenase-like oxidoreductase [SAR116 cluster alpha proteobacterium HIMB100]|nr:lactate dehydrogenase-like oxidoreductase [SAR116 cluster alpha proteobacterium HIMB100]